MRFFRVAIVLLIISQPTRKAPAHPSSLSVLSFPQPTPSTTSPPTKLATPRLPPEPSSSNPPPPPNLHPRPNHSANALLPGAFCINKKSHAAWGWGALRRARPAERTIDHYQISRYRAFAVQYLSRGRGTGVSDAALRSGKIGPIKAECFADLTNRTRVELMARTGDISVHAPSWIRCSSQHAIRRPGSPGTSCQRELR